MCGFRNKFGPMKLDPLYHLQNFLPQVGKMAQWLNTYHTYVRMRVMILRNHENARQAWWPPLIPALEMKRYDPIFCGSHRPFPPDLLAPTLLCVLDNNSNRLFFNHRPCKTKTQVRSLLMDFLIFVPLDTIAQSPP